MSITVTPQSTITICKCKLENDYKNTLNFSNLAAQTSYFNSLTQINIGNSDYTYVRKDNKITIEKPYDDVIGYNYLFYTNTGFTNKRYYCFITHIEYVNENTTNLYIETDVIQTWMFNVTYNPCYVEREHVSDDTLGKHTVPENLELGDYIVNAHLSDDYNNKTTLVYGTNYGADTMARTYGNDYNGVSSGVTYYHRDQMGGGQLGSISYDLDRLAQAGHVDEVHSMFVVPQWILGTSAQVSGEVSGSDDPATFDLGISRLSSLNGYTPKNKKLLTYPYCYILVTNGSGNSAVFHQELWKLNNQNDMVLRVYGVLCPGCSIRAYPVEYNGDGLGIDYGITLGKFPQINWATDQYTNWLTQNSVNIGIGAASSALSLGVGVATGNPVAVAGGLTAIAQSLNQVHQAEFIPSQIKGSANAGDVNFTIGANSFHSYRMSIRQEYAKIIDGFFNMFGYKVNELKVPQFTSRTYWNYVKTIDANIEGDLPQEDLEKFRNIFNNGITFWHDPTKMYDYTQNNTIVS